MASKLPAARPRSITGVRRMVVFKCMLRQHAVEIWYSDDHREPALFVDATTRQILRWQLTPQESRDLSDIITERYQPGGV